MTVIVFGSLNMDLIVGVPCAPEAGQTVTGTAFTTAPGGKGLNQAVAAARLGAGSAVVGRVGDDAYGRALREGLVAAGVDVGALFVDPAAGSGVALITVEATGENRIAVVPGANGAVDDSDVARLRSILTPGDLLLVQLEVPMAAVVSAVGVAADRGAVAIVDPAPVPRDGLPAGLYRPHVILTPNETEAAALVGHPVGTDVEAERAARTLLGRGLRAVVVTLGARGMCWAMGDQLGWQPALAVRVLDTVGAGDATNGALACALSEGATLPEAIDFATAAAAVAVTRRGGYAAMPTRADVSAQLVGHR